MDKIRFMRLWDLYGGLLTPTQREITDMYFNLDLTVSEIAEQKGISRQGVHDFLARAEQALEDMEEKIGCLARARRQQQALARIVRAAQALRAVPQAGDLAEVILAAAEEIKE